MHRYILLLALAIAVFIVACGDSTSTTDAGTDAGEPCTPFTGTSTSFTHLHEVIFSTTRCVSSVCHGGDDPPGEYRFDVDQNTSHQNLLAPVVNQTGAQSFAARVVPGDVEASYLWNRLSVDSVGGPQMPQGQRALDECELDAVRAWIESGAQNN